jgi:uncharacterized membrane protein
MTEQRMEQIVGKLLQAGVLLSAAVVIAGGAWLLARSGWSAPEYQHFHGEPSQLRYVNVLIASMAHPTPEVIVQLGLVLLIATPVARVAFSMAAFAIQRDHTYVVITLIVLAVLAYSLVIPHG